MPRKTKPLGDYAVGYGKPPEHTRFKAGQSGNPKGRAKGARDVRTVMEVIFRKEFSQRVTVVEGGKSRTVSKLELIAITNVNKAAKGDARALREILTLAQRVGLLEAAPAAAVIEEAQHLSVEDQAIVDRFLARERSLDAANANPEPSPATNPDEEDAAA